MCWIRCVVSSPPLPFVNKNALTVHNDHQHLFQIRQRPRLQRRQRGPHLDRYQRRAVPQSGGEGCEDVSKSISSPAPIGYADVDGAASFRDGYLFCNLTGANDGASAVDLFRLNN
jgi:hypothetical protein